MDTPSRPPTCGRLPGLPPRRLRGGDLTDAHRDLAASTQHAITAALVDFIARHRDKRDTRLCLAGGVAENSVAAGTIAGAGTFDDIYLAPACSDAGTALGAALLVAAEHGHRPERLAHTQLGPDYPDDQVAHLLRECGVRLRDTDDPTYIHADLREPENILAEAADLLDFTQPIGLILSGILGHVADTDEARSIVARLLDALPSGSYLSINDGTSVVAAEEIAQAQEEYNESGAVPYNLRTPEEIAGFFDGLELVEPGVVSCPLWRPDPEMAVATAVDAFGGVGRKR